MVAQVDIVERISGVVRRTIESRKSEDDIVEWSVALVPTYADCEDCGNTEFEFVVGFLARVYCPEIETTMVSNLLNPIGRNDEDVAEWVNHWWDRLTIERMSDALEAEDAGETGDTPGDGPEVDHLKR